MGESGAAGRDGELAAIQWVRNDIEPEMTRRMSDSIQEGRLLLNLRAEADPEVLTGIVKRALETLRGQAELAEKHYAAFKPSPPKPTHRVTELAGSLL